jgi:hypothetical protein
LSIYVNPMKGIYDKVVKLLVPILEGSSNISVQLRNKPENINFNELENNYNITILQEFDKIPTKILHKREMINYPKNNISIYLKKSTSKGVERTNNILFSIRKNRKKIEYIITKISFDNSVSFDSSNDCKPIKRSRDESLSEKSDLPIVKRPRSYSENLQINSSVSSTYDNESKDDSFSFDKLVSATKTRNYMLDDGILDFLDYYSRNPKKHSLTFNEIVGFESGYNTRSKNESLNIQKINYGSEVLNDMIKDEGIKYEKKVIDEITLKANSFVPPIEIETITTSFDIKSNFENTKKLIIQGKEIIYQAVLYNEDDNTFGCPDLIIRSDIIEKLFGDSYITNEMKEEYNNSKKENNMKHFYLIIDIKHSNLDFNSDERTLRNTETLKPYKSQLCVYNNALTKIQKFDPKIALVLGKSYTIKGIKQYDYFNKLGIIDYKDRDIDFIDKTKDAVNWIRRVREDGKYWVLDPIPSVKELFPRMNNEKDGKWKVIKQKVADKVGEISSVYYCGIKERKSAHEKNIYSWRDERCNSKTMGFNQNSNSKIPSTIDKILEINRSNSSANVLPQNIETKNIGSFNWRSIDKNSMEFYLDFETMNSNFFDISNFSYENVIVFQVGVGYIDSGGNWIYQAFVSKNKTFEGEKIMFKEFFKFVDDSFKKEKTSAKNDYHFVHWYPHEKICYDKIRSTMNLPNIKFMDLSKLFRDEPIVVKGSLRYKLKSISKALFDMGLISTSWDFSSECNSGLAAMALANKIYDELNEVTKDNEIMKEIIKYNEVDCKVLWDILRYLRENH